MFNLPIAQNFYGGGAFNNITKIAAILVLTALLPFSARSQWSSAFNLSPNAHAAYLNESMGSCIGVSGDTVHVVWADRLDNTHGVLYYVRSVDSGLSWSVPVAITDINGNAWNPAIAVTGPNLHVVWRVIDTLTNKRNSHYKHSLDGGITWGSDLTVDTSVADWPAVAVWGDTVYIANDILVTDTPYNTEVFFLRSLDNGFNWSAHQQITFSVGRSEDEAIIAQGSHVHMSWNDNRNNLFKIYYKQSDDYGLTWSNDTPVIPQYAYTTMVSVDGANVDVPGASAPVGRYQIHLAQSADTGASFPPDVDLTGDTAHEFVYPYMVRDGHDLHLTYVELGSGAEYIHSIDGGSTWSSPYNLGNSGITTFVAYGGCIVHVIVPDSGHINYFRNPTGNTGGHCGTGNSCANALTATTQLNNDVLCAGGATGSATAHVSGIAGPFSFVWNSDPIQTDSNLNNVMAGTYTVTVTDLNQCTATASVTINQPEQLSLSGSATGVACFNGDNGTATVTANGGTGSYQYVWNSIPLQTTATASNLTPGTYVVIVTDANNCTASDTLLVQQSGVIVELTDTSVDASCGSSNGSASITVINGTGPFTYAWGNGASSSALNNLGAGSYSVTVTGIGACTATASLIINSIGGAVVSASASNTTCGDSNGSATVTVNSGTGPYTYAWSDGATTASINNLSAGNYVATVTDGNGCLTISNFTVGQSFSPVLTISTVNASCDSANGSATVQAQSGIQPYNYIWSNGSTLSVVSNLIGGSYSVTVTDGGGCTSTATALVNSSTTNPVNLDANPTAICNGDSSYICATAGFISYLWSTGQNTPCIYTETSGNYMVTVTDSSNCIVISNAINITVYALPQPGFNISHDSLFATPAFTYQWLLNGVPINGANGEVYVVSQSGSYSLQETDSNGCSGASGSSTITISGIYDFNNNGSVKVYPNPFASQTTIEIISAQNPEQVVLKIFDLPGQEVVSKNFGSDRKIILDRGQLNSGIYFYRIWQNDEIIATGKIMVE